jgi:hypothetical protein
MEKKTEGDTNTTASMTHATNLSTITEQLIKVAIEAETDKLREESAKSTAIIEARFQKMDDSSTSCHSTCYQNLHPAVWSQQSLCDILSTRQETRPAQQANRPAHEWLSTCKIRRFPYSQASSHQRPRRSVRQ